MQIYKKSIELKSVRIQAESSLVIKAALGELTLDLSRIQKSGWFFVRRAEAEGLSAGQRPSLQLFMVVDPSQGARQDGEARFSAMIQHLQNAIIGVTSGFLSQLEIVGLGYRVTLPSAVGSSRRLRFKLGETHLREVPLKPDLVYKATAQGGGSRSGPGGEATLLMYGINKNQVFQTEASIAQRSKSGRGDVYKGKGIRPAGKIPKLKSGKRK